MRVARKGRPRTKAWKPPTLRDNNTSSVSQAFGTQTSQSYHLHLEHDALTYIHSPLQSNSSTPIRNPSVLQEPPICFTSSKDISLIVLILCFIFYPVLQCIHLHPVMDEGTPMAADPCIHIAITMK